MKKNFLFVLVIGAAAWGTFQASPVYAAVAYVQSTSTISANCGGVSNTVSVTFAANNSPGNLIVLTFSAAAIDAVPTVSDTMGNAYFHAIGEWDKTNSRGLEVYYASNIASGANTVSVIFNSSNTNCRLAVHEYSGVATTTPVLDAVSMNVNNGGTTSLDGVTSNAATTRTDGALIFGVVENDSAATTVAAGTGFVKRASMSADEMVTEDRTQASAGAIAATFTDAAASSYLAQLVAFRAAGASFSTSSITHVQGNSSYDNTCLFGIAASFPTANLAGDLIVVSASYTSPAPLLADVTITDSRGNTYGQAVTRVDAATGKLLAISYAPNIRNGTNTVTIGFPNASNVNCKISVHEYSGVATDTPAIDIVSANNSARGTSTADGVTSRPATTFTNGALIFGALDNVSSTVAVSKGAGFTLRGTSYSGEMVTEDRIQGSAGAIAATFTDATSTGYIAGMVAFRAAGVPFVNPNPWAVQYNAASDNGCAGGRISTAFPGPNIQGDLIVLSLTQRNRAAVPSISDTQGNVYTMATNLLWDSTDGVGLTTFYAPNIRNGTNTVTVNFAPAETYCRVAAVEYINIVTSTPLFNTAQNVQSSLTSTSTDKVSSGGVGYYTLGDLMFGTLWVANDSPGNTLAGSGFTERTRIHGDAFITEDRLVTSTGPNAAKFTFTTAGPHNTDVHLLIFRAVNSILRYATGTLDSTTFDTGVPSGAQYNSITWLGSAPLGTSAQFQFAASTMPGGPWDNYTGPDGTANTYYAGTSGVSTPLAYQTYNNRRYYRYRLWLFPDSAGLSTPRVDGVMVNWSP